MVFGCFAGFSGFDCSILWIIMILLFFIAAIFRKNIAEDLIGVDFSLIGSSVVGIIVFVVMTYITHSIKWSAIIAVAGVISGGFIGATFLPDGSSSDSGGGESGWF